MNSTKPPRDPSQFERSPGEFEALLRSFFKAQMPHPWPVLKLPAEPDPVRRKPRPRSLFQSRFALAASVAILALGCLWLAGAFRNEKPAAGTPSLDNSEATRKLPLPEKTGFESGNSNPGR